MRMGASPLACAERSYVTELQTGNTFFSDSGFQLRRREYVIGPINSNYYPMTQLAALRDPQYHFNVSARLFPAAVTVHATLPLLFLHCGALASWCRSSRTKHSG